MSPPTRIRLGSVGLTDTESMRPPTPGSPSGSQVEVRSLGPELVVDVVGVVPVVGPVDVVALVVVVGVLVVVVGVVVVGVGVVAPGEVTPRVGGAVVVGAGALGAVWVGALGGTDGGVAVGGTVGPDGVVVGVPVGAWGVGAAGGLTVVLVFGLVALGLVDFGLVDLRDVAQRDFDARDFEALPFFALLARVLFARDLAAFALAARGFLAPDFAADDFALARGFLDAGHFGVDRGRLRAARVDLRAGCLWMAVCAGRLVLAPAVAAQAQPRATTAAINASVVKRTLPTSYVSASCADFSNSMHWKIDECPSNIFDATLASQRGAIGGRFSHMPADRCARNRGRRARSRRGLDWRDRTRPR